MLRTPSSPSGRRRSRLAQRPAQAELRFTRTWGGRRAGAGRPKLKNRKSVPHRARPEHSRSHPVHVTLRAARRLPSLRRQSLFLRIRDALGEASRSSFRLAHFSVQADHVHLIVEAIDKSALTRGTRGLCIRVARAINKHLGRSGRAFGDRYHARALATPREVRNAIVYVLQNWRKHVPSAKGVDPCSSGWWFTGWQVPPSGEPPGWTDIDHAPVMLARTWLGAHGWRRYGAVGLGERPKVPSSMASTLER